MRFIGASALKMERKETFVKKVVQVQAEETSAGANTVGIVEIRLQKVNYSLYRRKSTGKWNDETLLSFLLP